MRRRSRRPNKYGPGQGQGHGNPQLDGLPQDVDESTPPAPLPSLPPITGPATARAKAPAMMIVAIAATATRRAPAARVIRIRIPARASPALNILASPDSTAPFSPKRPSRKAPARARASRFLRDLPSA